MKSEQEAKGYQIIIKELRNMLSNGELKCGDKLPSERKMTEMFQLSRTSVREALRSLEMMGIVEKRHGEGNYVVDHAESSMIDVLSIMLIMNKGTMDDFMEFRKWIELGAIKNVIEYSSDEEIDGLEAYLAGYEDHQTVHDRTQQDISFHKAIVGLSKNPFFIYIFNAFSVLAATHLEQMLHELTSNGRDRRRVDSIHQEHLDLLSAIRERDYEQAQKIATSHIITIRN
ncbi:MAG: FadR family transcriptional regulator [Lachnospiraceae bacterium]